MSLLSFPNEIIVHIISFLSVEDVLKLSIVSKSFHQAIQIEEVWRRLSKTDYGVNIGLHDSFTCRDFYLKVLKCYGELIGFWQASVASYGGLLHIKYKDGMLVGSELHPSYDPHIQKPMRVRTLFKIGIDEENQIKKICIGDNLEEHDAFVEVDDKNTFRYRCCDLNMHRSMKGHQQLYLQEFLEWFREELALSFDAQMFPYSQELLLMKLLTITRYNLSFQYKRLQMPEKTIKLPIEAGLFQGTYGAHGLELIMLNYEETGRRVKAVKVTGDPNVPALEVTFHANLDFPFDLNMADQQTINILSDVQAEEILFDRSKEPPSPQPFLVPVDCSKRYDVIPKLCTYRFQGWGQIASHGFSNPSFSRGHWIVFTEDMFGFLWLELSSLSMYYRVKEFS